MSDGVKRQATLPKEIYLALNIETQKGKRMW